MALIVHEHGVMPSLSVCLIVRNEERHLARCLASIRGLADEVIVVDTGSTDRTLDIAREHGARIHHFTWCDDFAAARNFSLEQATGDWILALDADEAIAARDHAVIRAAIADANVDAELVAQRHYLRAESTPVGWQPGSGGYPEGEAYPGFLDVDCRRLFRNAPWLRFQNAVHEELVSIDASRRLRERRGRWVIHHFGKVDGREVTQAKGRAYLRIGLKKAADRPRDPQAHFELGVQYAELGLHEEAIGAFTRALALSPRIRDARLRLGLCHFELKQYREALEAFRACARTLPAQAIDIALAEGNAHRELGDHAAAEQAFSRVLALSPGHPGATMNLALLHTSHRRFADALRVLDPALERYPTHPELRALRGGVRVDAGDTAGALADLEPLGNDARALFLRARALARDRRFAEARACLAAREDDGDPKVNTLRGVVALGLGEVADAVALLRDSMDRQPTAEAAMNLSLALDAAGDRPAALAAAVEASRLAPSGLTILSRAAALAGDCTARARDGAALTIAFYQPHSIPFDGQTPRTRGLGGTESAIVYLAEALAARGHRCVVLNNCPEPTTVNGVEYARWETLGGRVVADRPDVLVGVRFWEAIGRVRLAPVQILWTGDAFDQPFVKALADADTRAAIDLFMLQSDWHEATFRTHHRLPASQIVRTTLGAAASAATPPIVPVPGPRPRRLAYASTPFRGLDVLLDLFPRIRAACPDAELEVFSSMQVYGVSAEEDRQQFEAIYRKAKQPGVTLVGTVPQMELARRLQQARVLAYPNHYAETFCIAAAEAQAAGCVVVTSALGALPETVGDAGLCVAGDPRSGAYQEAFVGACVALLTDDARWEAMSARAIAQAGERFAWPRIAAHWEETCRAALTIEPPEIARLAVHLASGRGALAQKMIAKLQRPANLPADAWEALHHVIAAATDGGAQPSDAAVRSAALHFRSLRRAIPCG